MSTIKANTYLDASGGNTATINGVTPALASQAQAEAGTDNTVQMTPLRVSQAIASDLNVTGTAPLYAARAWVNFNGTGTIAIRASGNVTSVTDGGTGTYQVNFTTALLDANYAPVTMFYSTATNVYPYMPVQGGFTTTAFSFQTITASIGLFDPDRVICAIFR